jgi:integrase
MRSGGRERECIADEHAHGSRSQGARHAEGARCRRSPRSPATPGFHTGRPPRNKGRRYPADPPTVAEIVAVMRQAGDSHQGWRLRARIVVLRRAGLRIHEALALSEADLDRRRGSVLVRRGKGGRRHQVGMDDWAWEQVEPWLKLRVELPVGPLFCDVSGPTRGRAWSAAAARSQRRETAAMAGVRRRFAPHQLRHAHAVERAREGVRLLVIQRQLGHTTSALPRSTSRASTAPRSSTPSTPAAHRWFRSTAHCERDHRRSSSKSASGVLPASCTRRWLRPWRAQP